MHKYYSAALAAAFATASTFAMIATAAQHPSANPNILSASSSIALADNENDGHQGNEDNQGNDNHGGQDCTNPAGHQRGWCKHQGDSEDNEGGKHHKHRHHRGSTTISGTVLGVNGNTAQFRLDNGQVITINENGTALNVGQHYNLSGCYQNNQFMLNCSNGGNGNNGGNAQVGGTILSVGNGTVTLLGIPTVTINVSQAVNRGATNGPLTAGRHITAYGYYNNNVFYATSIQ
ncbi:MAG: hypothetical protein M3N19_09730 [Candidatus Eremiobacteraeota bacterium]|nr:hypothetical protein [Candidatus Eremiobacteraeota bacterium]